MNNVFLMDPCKGLVVEDATLAEWLAAGGSPLAGATLVPMEGDRAAAKPLTLTTGPHDAPVRDAWGVNHGR